MNGDFSAEENLLCPDTGLLPAFGVNDPMGASVPEPVLSALVERIVDQDQQAFAELYRHLLGRVYGLALRITCQAETAEEVAEDVFWQVWRQAPRYDATRGGVVAWVMTIARSRALDALRKRDLPEEDDMNLSNTASGESPPEVLSAWEQGGLVHQALAQLEPLPRQLVALAFFRGLSHEDIAEQTALPLGTVKSHIRRALIQLRTILAPVADEQTEFYEP